MEPIEFLKIARRRWWIIAGTASLFVLLSWVTSPKAPPVRRVEAKPAQPRPSSFTATHTLVNRGTSLIADSTPRSGTVNLEVIALYIKTGEVPNRVAWKLLPDVDPALLVAQIETKVEAGAGTISITAKGNNGERAAELVNTFAAELLAYLSEQQAEAHQRNVMDTLERSEKLREKVQDLELRLASQPPPGDAVLRAQRDALVRQYSVTFERYQQLNGQGPPPPPLVTAQAATPVGVFAEKKAPPPVTVPKDRGGRAPLAGILGLLVGFGLAIGVDRLDTRLRTREQFVEVLHLPVLVEVPKTRRGHRRTPKLITAAQPGSPEAEAFRMLRATLPLVGHADGARRDRTRGLQVILVTSAASRDGKTTVAANLGASFAEAGRRVLVLDCDFWRPKLHEMVGLTEGLGVLDTLGDPADGAVQLADVVRPTPVPRLTVATAGRGVEHAAELVARASDLIAQARQLADIVIIDTGPILASSNVTELLPAVDAVIVVVRSGKTSPVSAQRTVESLTRLDAPTLGVVVVGVDRPLWRGRHYAPIRPMGHSSAEPGSLGDGEAVNSNVNGSPVVPALSEPQNGNGGLHHAELLSEPHNGNDGVGHAALLSELLSSSNGNGGVDHAALLSELLSSSNGTSLEDPSESRIPHEQAEANRVGREEASSKELQP